MVEGHSVHRVAAQHRKRLVGKKFVATSPNGRFAEGARAISGKTFDRIEAVGKNLFAFFGQTVVHVHFGMAGQWSIFDGDEPETTATTRLRLQCGNLTSHLSAMTVAYGPLSFYEDKRRTLGEDPLRADADPDALWVRVAASKKSIGALIMDQSFFAGPGNIYRAEILFKAGIYPDVPGRDLSRAQFDAIWSQTVDLLYRGFQCGSIITVDQPEATNGLRRYVYGNSTCPRCATRVNTWDMQGRTVWACPKCQLKKGDGRRAAVADKPPTMQVDSFDAAAEKARAGESRAVEHIAELHPVQAAQVAERTQKSKPNKKRRRLSPSPRDDIEPPLPPNIVTPRRRSPRFPTTDNTP